MNQFTKQGRKIIQLHLVIKDLQIKTTKYFSTHQIIKEKCWASIEYDGHLCVLVDTILDRHLKKLRKMHAFWFSNLTPKDSREVISFMFKVVHHVVYT